MTDKILRIPDAEYVNIIRIVCPDHPTEDILTYLDSDLEPAPPKDWKPVCYNYSELNEGCEQIPFISSPECDQCPYKNVKPSNEEK